MYLLIKPLTDPIKLLQFFCFRLTYEGHDLEKKDDDEFIPKELSKILKKEWLLPLFERKVNWCVFKTLSNIYDEAFLLKQLMAKRRSLFSKKAPSRMFERVLNTFLKTSQFSSFIKDVLTFTKWKDKLRAMSKYHFRCIRGSII